MLFLRKSRERETIITSRIPTSFKKYFIWGAKRLHYENEALAVFSQYITLGKFTMWFHVIRVSKTVEVSPLSIEPGLKLNFMLSEVKANASLNNIQRVVLAPGFTNLFLVGKELSYAELSVGTHIFFHLDLHRAAVSALYENPDAAPLLQAIAKAYEEGGGHINMDQPISTSVFCSNLIEEIRQHRYRGKATQVYLLKKANQLLHSFAREFSNLHTLPDVPLTVEDLHKLDEVKTYVKAHLHQPLSKRHLYRILEVQDPELLLQQFKKLHDISIPEFHLHYRMEKVFDRTAKTNSPFSKIAHNAGYRDLPAFLRAFKSYFNCNPLLLRG